jgi:putative transposase
VNQRNDFLHKLSTKLIRENQTICLEDLNVQGMMQNHCLADSIAKTAWSSFESMLKYKSDWYGRNLIQIGQFEPSSKLSNCCGARNESLRLSDRTWKCPKCQKELDRDINAAQNIKVFALQKQNLINQVPMDNREVKSVERSVCKNSRRSRNRICENLESQQL